MRGVLHRVGLVAGVLFCISTQGFAGAWNQDVGHGQLIFTSSFFQTSSQFDANGATQHFGGDGKFRQFNLNPYFEYGLTQRNTLVMNANAPFLKFSNDFGSETSAGIGDMEVALKRRFNNVESAWALSGQITVSFPAYGADRNPAPGNHQEDVETRFLLGRGLMIAHHKMFWDAETAYRYRSGAPTDQIRADITGGFDITPRFMAMAQFFAIKGLRNGDLFSTTNPNAQSDFDLYKSQLSLVAKVSHTLRLQAGWCDAFSGRNTGRGHTAILAVWKTF